MSEAVDLHVHLVGNGRSGSGCRIRTRWWQGLFVQAMTRNIGLRSAPSDRDLDSSYVFQLGHWLEDSSLAAAVILACDEVYEENGNRRSDLSGFYVPNDFVLQTARERPGFLAGASIHPARPDAMEALECCADAGAVLIKLLPCMHMIDPNRRAYKRFWQRMADLRLPLLAHTGGEFSLPTYRWDLQNPECLRLPLDCGVTVIAAHCGTRALPCDHDYFDVFESMRHSYPNLYGDLAALSQPTHLRSLARLRENPERILYGSDYPVVTAVLWSKLKGWFSNDEYRRLRAIKNPLEKTFQFTRALGFPDSVFTDAWKLLRLPERKGIRNR
jgi:uncharacterized protein